MITAAAAVLAIACAGSEGGSGSDRDDWTTAVDTVGDTIVVRTTGGTDTSGVHTLVDEVTIGELDAVEEAYSFGGINELEVSPDGRIYVFDRQVPALREYDPAGKYVRTLGRKGKGPGEYEQPNGLAIHRDGRVVLWDGTTARVNVYGQDGTFITSWPLPGGSGFFTNGGLLIDTAGNTYARTRIADPPKDNPPGTSRIFGTTGLVKWDRDGKIVDSLTPPPPTVQPQQLVASREGGTSITSVPFSPRHVWGWSPLGYFISMQSDRYAVILSPPDGKPRRIERESKPVALDGDERAYYEERSTASMRMTDPSWRWSGPSIPDTKGAIASIVAADDGRIWVAVPQRGERVPESELPPPPAVQVGTVGDRRMPPVRWRDPSVYDVFEPTGEYLGRVAAPLKTTFRTMRGDHIWAVRRDSLDVEQVVRFRVVPGFGEQKVDAPR
jgi:hypothetical protein